MTAPSHSYDPNNVFAKIIRGKLPANKIYENEHALSFHDLYPDAPVHALVIPKGPYVDWGHFAATAPAEEVHGLHQAVLQTVEMLGLKNGYRLATNVGAYAHQAIYHFHYHILSGTYLGGMVNLGSGGEPSADSHKISQSG